MAGMIHGALYFRPTNGRCSMASWGLSLATYPQDPPYAGILLGSLVSETMREEEYVRTHEPVEPVCDWGLPSIKNHFPVVQVSSLNQIISNGVASRRDCTYWTRVQIEISWLHSPGYSGYPKSWQASLRDTAGSQYISRQMSTHCLGIAIHTPISLESCCSIGILRYSEDLSANCTTSKLV